MLQTIKIFRQKTDDWKHKNGQHDDYPLTLQLRGRYKATINYTLSQQLLFNYLSTLDNTSSLTQLLGGHVQL